MARKKHNLEIEEKIKIVQEIDNGQISLHEASRKYGASVTAIRYWRDKFSKGKLQERSSKKERLLEKENQKLKEMLGQMHIEMELLKKAQALAKQKINANSSVITKKNLAQFLKDAE